MIYNSDSFVESDLQTHHACSHAASLRTIIRATAKVA